MPKNLSQLPLYWADLQEILDNSNEFVNSSEFTNYTNRLNDISPQHLEEITKNAQKYIDYISTEKDLNSSIEALQNKYANQLKELAEKATKKSEDKTAINQLKETVRSLQNENNLKILLNQVNEEAKTKILKDESFRDFFLSKGECHSFVLAMDIRRSTELMLKARTPRLFESFITQLCTRLSNIITKNFGIVDKFTGDGILAYFPDFYSGDDAGFFAFKSAIDCHTLFDNFYRSHRNTFNSVLSNAGLGIGIDYGKTYMATIQSRTVIGSPVVYACRMSAAPANTTNVNQPAFEILSERYSDYITFTETSINLKHEGETLAYSITPTDKDYDPIPPNWDELIKRFPPQEEEALSS